LRAFVDHRITGVNVPFIGSLGLFRRTLRTTLVLAAALLAGATAYAQTPVKFTLNFKPDGSNAAWFLAQERGYFKQAGLDVSLDSSNGTGDVLSRLGNGSYDAGFADMSALVEFAGRNPQEAPVAVLVIYNNSPLAVVTLKKSGIMKPADMVGRKFAGPISDGAYRMLPAFAKTANIDASQLKIENVDIRVRETLLMRGDVDGVFGFDSSVWFNLKSMGVKQDDVVFIRYADYGLDFYGNALLVSRKFLAGNPAAVQAFAKATAMGWRDALADPAAAIEALAKRDGSINKAIETEKLQFLLKNQITSPLAMKDGFGNVDPARLNKQIDIVTSTFGVPTKPSADSVYNGKFMPAAGDRAVPKAP
jgi:NitT/TauT family transport system substrate-binding protein